MKRKNIFSWLILIFAACVLLSAFFGKSGSHLPPKSQYVEFQINLLHTYADPFKEQLLKMDSLNNVAFVSTVKPGGSIWKYNDKGELLDPWGQPYIISKENSEISIISPGLERHKRLSWYKKIFDR